MSISSMQYDEIKRKIRKLKKLEIKIRYGFACHAEKPRSTDLVWDSFFDLHEAGTTKAKYSIQSLFAMSKEEYKSVIDEFFYQVYYRFYKETGVINPSLFNPDALSRLGLPFDADQEAIKRKFRTLAVKYHPDTGGDADQFILLMENYRKLIEKGD